MSPARFGTSKSAEKLISGKSLSGSIPVTATGNSSRFSYGVKCIIKRDLRKEPGERHRERGERYGGEPPRRDGKNVWRHSWGNVHTGNADALGDADEASMRGPMAMAVAATERLTDANAGEVFRLPEIAIETWRTAIDGTAEECIASCHDHGTGDLFS